jgi:hypothetical protein
MPKKPGSHHVVPNADGGWDVKKDGATRSSGHFDKKQEAVDAGRKISQNQGTEFYIHGKDGKIQNKDSHGNDPVWSKNSSALYISTSYHRYSDLEFGGSGNKLRQRSARPIVKY